MLEIVWDEDIAIKAQEHASTCNFEHDTGADRKTTKFSWVGQNLAISFSNTGFPHTLTNL